MKPDDLVVVVPRHFEGAFIAKLISKHRDMQEFEYFTLIRHGHNDSEAWYSDCLRPIDSLTKLEKALYGI